MRISCSATSTLNPSARVRQPSFDNELVPMTAVVRRRYVQTYIDEHTAATTFPIPCLATDHHYRP